MHPTLLAQSQGLGGTIQFPGAFATDPSSYATDFDNLATTIFGFLTLVAGLAFALYFILGAINWIQGGGDQQKVQKAKDQMTSAAIGLVIVVSAYAIIGIVGGALGINILQPSELLESF